MKKKLNIGCGNDIKKDWINLDVYALDGVDVVHDINKLPLPFSNDEFDYVLCKDVFEHVEYIPLLKEIHRILKPNGIVEIRVPHFCSRLNYIDPTHVKRFSIQTFDFFTKNTLFNRSYYFDYHFNSISYRKIYFSKRWIFFINYIIEPIVNLSLKTQTFYEASFLSRLFPCFNIIVKLKK